MHQTFEEFAGLHIDGLYHGALFLHAGEESPADDLVLWTLTSAFQEFRRIGAKVALEQWLEGRLVAVFLARSVANSIDDGPTDAFSGEDVSTDDVSVEGPSVDVPSSAEPSTGPFEIDPEALFGAAVNMPPLARAAIWLVLFRRWSYEEAASVLGTGVDGLKALLRYRHVLLTALVPRSADRNGTDHDLRN
jgi:DNA-directed RNA polymerase specialized sigma24 family protein